MNKFIGASYFIGISFVATTNTIKSPFTTGLIDTMWKMTNLKTKCGQTVGIATIVLAPFLIPAYTVTLPFVYGMCKLDEYNRKD